MNLVNSSIVLVQKDYTSISHDFLERNRIIPETFKQTDQSFNTPVVSQINYSNGFKIISEGNRIIFHFDQHSSANESDNLSYLQDIVSKYMNLWNINYQAVGINFDFISDNLPYKSFVKTFMKEDSTLLKKFEEHEGKVHGVDLSYVIQGKTFNISVKEIINNDTKERVTFFKVNVHYPIGYTDNKKSIIKELKENYEKSKKFIGGF